MARLRRIARRNAKLQYGPVRRDIRRQRGEAKQTYRVGKRQERQAASGIRAAVEAAIKDVAKDYRSSMAESRMADRLGGDIGTGIIADADTLSRRQTKRGIAEAMAGELADLEARGVQAQDASAYGIRGLRGQRDATLKGLSQERAATAREQGQFALSELSRLRSERADQRLARRGMALDEAAFAETQRQNRVGNRLSRRGIRLDEYEAAHPGESSSSRGADTVHSQGIKQQILDATAKYRREIAKGTPLREIAADARKHDVSDQVLDAASRMATLGYLTPDAVRKLRAIGVRVPRAWRTPPRKG
jgi:hypothetical protein